MNYTDEQLRDILGDFRNYLFVIWKHLKLPEPTWVQYEVADYLMSPKRRKIIEGFRGMGKSWITSAYVTWKLRRDPNYKFLVVSASKDRSDAFTTFTKRLISEVPLLEPLKPKKAKNWRDSMVSFDVGLADADHAPSVKSVGIFGQMTGSRADEIVADDVEVPNNSYTQDNREKLLQRCMEFEAIIKPETGKITYLGTPQTEESIYNKLIDRGYDRVIYPARYPDLSSIRKYEGDVAERIMERVESNPDIVGETTDPDRFSNEDLAEREAAYGRSGFALQFMLDTSLSDADRYPLKLRDLIVTSVDPEKAPQAIYWSNDPNNSVDDLPNVGFSGDRFYRERKIDSDYVPYQGIIMAIDPSGRGKDETTYIIAAQINGYIYILDGGGYSGGYSDATLQKLSRKAKEFKVNNIIIEANYGDGMFTRVFQPILKGIYRDCGIEEVKHYTNKEQRIIDTLEPVMNRHRLVMNFDFVKNDIYSHSDSGRSLNYSLFYQMTHLTRERGALKHDDMVDALAMAVNYWLEAMAQDEQEQMESRKEELLEKDLEEFMSNVVSNKYKDSKGDDFRDGYINKRSLW